MSVADGGAAARAAGEVASDPADEPLIAVDGLSVSYRGDESSVAAVRDVSLEVRAGETLALVGESAAGKSTVGHALLGLLPANAEVSATGMRYQGRSLIDMSSEELRQIRGEQISMIFQDAIGALTPTLRVREQLVELFQAHRDLSKEAAEAEAFAALQRMLPDAERAFDLYPFQLSGVAWPSGS